MATTVPILSRTVVVLVVVLSMLLAAACGSGAPGGPTPTPTLNVDLHPALGEPFTLPLGGSAFLDKQGFRITFLRVVSDSRCPLNVTCVTGGAAVIEMAVRETAGSPEETLLWSIGPDHVEPPGRAIGGLVIELLEVEPVPGGPQGPVGVRLVVTPAIEFPFLSLSAQASLATVRVGDTFEVVTDAGGGGIPQYALTINGVGVSIVNHSGAEVASGVSDRVTVLSFTAGMTSARWALRADAPGELAIHLFVSAEVRAGADGPWVFTHGTSDLTVTALPPGTQ